ncbi:hypothetical protein N7532_010705 [Penicillium argentinense]|uniref:Uncharacterized protein n=1 Tax=Penicillium argentinense TaxID=1131581 RepID=A0A9W9JXW2_9EURO|nr:uncharacterized protein N7532_010705 [Penicillium argentinense]KAJ5085934.1 hypothetical protein N7532_010705 [Penicillium argentinense]
MDAELHAQASSVSVIYGDARSRKVFCWYGAMTATSNAPDRKGRWRETLLEHGPSEDLLKMPPGILSSTYSLPSGPKLRCLVEYAEGQKVAELGHKKFLTSEHTAIDAEILSSVALIEMQPWDTMGLTTNVNIGNNAITEISIRMNNRPNLFVRQRSPDYTVYQIRAAKGLGLSLVCF